jgi:hypothetical protein
MSKKQTGIDWLLELTEKLDLVAFESLARDILNHRRSGDIVFELGFIRSSFGASEPVLQDLATKYNIDKVLARTMINALGYLFRKMMIERKKLVETLKEKIPDKAEKLVAIGDKLMVEYPEIRQTFFIRTFCKTRYFVEMDWEISVKTEEPSDYGFEKSDRFPVCTLRFFLEDPSTLRYPNLGHGRNDIVFEVSSSDIDEIIKTLSEAKTKLASLRMESTGGT